MLLQASVIVFGYLLGSVSSAILTCRLLGLGDPRLAGSGNPGATNVLRLYGRRAALITLAGDVLKGVIPVLLAVLIRAPDAVIAGTAVTAFAGHLYPVFFQFHGGKGVATLIGVLAAVYWPIGLAFILTWLAVAAVFRYSSLAAISAALLTPLYTWLLLPQPAYVFSFCLLALLLLWRHRSNIRHLLAGTEDRIGAGRR